MSKKNKKEQEKILLENCKKRKSDTFFYKIKNQLILYIIPILLGIVGYFLISFFTGNSLDIEKNALAHEEFKMKDSELDKRVSLFEQNNQFIINSLNEFKIDLKKRLDRIERKLDDK